jgi:hypothetical protein
VRKAKLRMRCEFTSKREEVQSAVGTGIEHSLTACPSNFAPLVGGRDTAADAIIGLASGRNVAEGFDGYKPMSPEAILAAAPEIILMMDGRGGEHGLAGLLETRPRFRLTPAGRNGRLVTMPGLLLLDFGPRTPEPARGAPPRWRPFFSRSRASAPQAGAPGRGRNPLPSHLHLQHLERLPAGLIFSRRDRAPLTAMSRHVGPHRVRSMLFVVPPRDPPRQVRCRPIGATDRGYHDDRHRLA